MPAVIVIGGGKPKGGKYEKNGKSDMSMPRNSDMSMPGNYEKDDDGEDQDLAKEAKIEAVREMFEMAKKGDFEGAAQAFKDAYDACAAPSSEEE